MPPDSKERISLGPVPYESQASHEECCYARRMLLCLMSVIACSWAASQGQRLEAHPPPRVLHGVFFHCANVSVVCVARCGISSARSGCTRRSSTSGSLSYTSIVGMWPSSSCRNCCLVDDGLPRRIFYHYPRSHARDLVFSNEMAGCFGQQHVDGYDGPLDQQAIQGDALGLVLRQQCPVAVGGLQTKMGGRGVPRPGPVRFKPKILGALPCVSCPELSLILKLPRRRL